MMADFVVPRHSAVMERLRRRIELFRRHHTGCEKRYDNTALERLDLERQQTFALHQRCLQTKAKRSNKHRQPQPQSGGGGDQQAGVQRGGGPGTGGSNTDLGDSGGAPGEQSRNSTLIALQETVKRKLESASSPLGRDQVNGFSDSYPPSKKTCLDNGTANGGLPPRSPMDTKHGICSGGGIRDTMVSNGNHGRGGDSGDICSAEQEFRLKEMKQEPDDILPCMLPSGGGANNSLFPDLNLNEQEWTELMEELNRSVAYEDIQDILNDGFEDRKDPPDLAPTPGSGVGAGAAGASAGGAGGGSQVSSGQSSQGLLPPDLVSVKAEYSPASVAFEQDRTGSPQVRPTSSGPPAIPTNSPATNSSASSPAMSQPQQPQQAPPSRQHQPPNHLLPSGPQVSKDLSPAQQLQQLAAQQRAQQMHNQLQHQQKQHQVQKQQQQQQQQAAKFHPQGAHPHPPSWPQTVNPSQSPLGGNFGMEKPSSPSLFPQDFNPNAPKQLLMPGQANKLSPKAGAGGYMPGPGGHPNMLSHPGSGAPLSHPAPTGGQPPSSMLNYSNTKPLSHFEAGAPGPGPPRGPPNAQNQPKAALLSLLRQQQQMKQKAGMPFRPHLPHAQDQGTYPTGPHGPGSANAMANQTGGNTMAGNHGNTAYLAAALKQQQQQQQQQQHQQQQQQHQQQQMQLLEQQKQYLMGQRQQQLMAEQEKQRQQQEQQLQRHLTRPPPQYQDQAGQAANQNPFQQQQVNQFTGSSQAMGNVSSMGGAAPGAQRMFPQNQGMMGMNMGQSGGPASGVAPPPAASQSDMSLPPCGGGGGMDVQQVLYSNMNMHPSHPNHPSHPSQQGGMQRQPVGPMSANYRQNLLAQQQQHLKNQPNAALLKQQQLAAAARLPGSMPNSIGANMPNSMSSAMSGSMQSSQSQAWQQQHQGIQQALGAQPPSSNGGMPPNAFANPNAFHMQQQSQTRMPKLPPGGAPFGANPNVRPMAAMNQQMMQANMAAAQQRAPPNPQSLGQPLPNQQQQAQPQQAAQNQAVLPDLGTFGQLQGNSRQGLQCNQGYQLNRTANQQQQQPQQQQQLAFGYNPAPGAGALTSFPGESDLDSLLKGQSTQEWMDDLDELLASHH